MPVSDLSDGKWRVWGPNGPGRELGSPRVLSLRYLVAVPTVDDWPTVPHAYMDRRCKCDAAAQRNAYDHHCNLTLPHRFLHPAWRLYGSGGLQSTGRIGAWAGDGRSRMRVPGMEYHPGCLLIGAEGAEAS